MAGRYLIINADDFGLRTSVNEAVMRLFAEGRITSTCLLAPAPHAREAAELAAGHSLPAGVHWTLTSEWADEPWPGAAAAERVPSLLWEGGLHADGRRMARTARSRQVTRELDAQVGFMAARGCFPDHADSHGGTLYGMNGRLFFVNAFRLCRRYRLPFRFPRSSRFLARQFGGQVSPALRTAHKMIVGLGNAMGVTLLDDMITNPYPAGKIDGYEHLREFYIREIIGMGEGVTELFMHPALPDADMSRRTGEWTKREWEMRLLMEPELHRVIDSEGITLTSWGNAPFAGRRTQR